jgi:Rad3-related DNA helicase
VLGGSFGEGIDLPGSRLVGAFIATLGLPQTNPVNDAMRSRLEVAFGSGYDYAYLYPGMRKVVQAAGRVIRTPDDKGVVYLIDDRFSRPAVRALLPEWWPPSTVHRQEVRNLPTTAQRGAGMTERS